MAQANFMSVGNQAVSILASCVLVAATAGCISAQQIEQMAAEQFKQMRAELPLSDSAADNAYVRCISTAIIGQLDEPYASYDWDIALFEDEAVNAFAMPGGKIGVYTGIFEVAVNKDQLATVISHEVAHVTEDHSLERANREQWTHGIAVIGSEVVDYNTGLETTDIVVLGAQLGLLLPYGRADESEADLIGLRYMASAGFDPRASIALWANMAAKAEGGSPELLSTHPSEETRMSRLSADMPEAMRLYEQAQAEGHQSGCQR